MAEDRIQRKDLLKRLGNIKKEDWFRFAEANDLRITQPSKKGTSHFAIRRNDPSIPDSDLRGLITTVYDGMSKQVNKIVFKRLLDCGFSEDDIWRGLGLL